MLRLLLNVGGENLRRSVGRVEVAEVVGEQGDFAVVPDELPDAVADAVIDQHAALLH
jgi:hypothetical protein